MKGQEQPAQPCATPGGRVRHLSLRLRFTGVLPGRIGMTLCGNRDAMDQPRLRYRLTAGGADEHPVPVIADLPLCRRCESTRIRSGLPMPPDERPAGVR